MIPFSGLAIISHFIIILVFKFCRKINFRFSFNFLKKEAVSYLIILLVFGAITANAFFITKNSIKNSPNIQIIENSFSNERAIAGSFSSVNSNGVVSNNESKLLLSLGANSEGKKYLSIIDFLDSIGVDSSFKNRVEVAKNFSINNYIGSAEQNIKLLSILQN